MGFMYNKTRSILAEVKKIQAEKPSINADDLARAVNERGFLNRHGQPYTGKSIYNLTAAYVHKTRGPYKKAAKPEKEPNNGDLKEQLAIMVITNTGMTPRERLRMIKAVLG